MTRKLMAAAMIAGVMLVSACNTVSGAGRDLQSASEAGREAIN